MAVTDLDPPLIGIVIVGYNSARWLAACIGSLVQDDPKHCQVIYVDNASSDESVSIVSQFGDVVILRNSRNFGFGAASNMGARKAVSLGARSLFFLNPDTIITIDTIERCCRFLRENPHAGTACPAQFIYRTTSLNPWTRKAVASFGTPAIRHSGILPESEKDAQNILSQGPVVVEYSQGAAFAIASSLFMELSGFAPAFFLFFEEVDLCRRVAMRGMKNFMLGDLRVQHAWGGHVDGFRKQQWLTSRAIYVLTDSSASCLKRISVIADVSAKEFVACKNPMAGILQFTRMTMHVTRRMRKIRRTYRLNVRARGY